MTRARALRSKLRQLRGACSLYVLTALACNYVDQARPHARRSRPLRLLPEGRVHRLRRGEHHDRRRGREALRRERQPRPRPHPLQMQALPDERRKGGGPAAGLEPPSAAPPMRSIAEEEPHCLHAGGMEDRFLEEMPRHGRRARSDPIDVTNSLRDAPRVRRPAPQPLSTSPPGRRPAAPWHRRSSSSRGCPCNIGGRRRPGP